MTKTSFTELQNQAIEAMRQQQDAYLNAVRTWKSTASGQGFSAANLPKAPEFSQFPAAEDLPTAAEFAAANQKFMQQVFEQQQRFLASLNDILGD